MNSLCSVYITVTPHIHTHTHTQTHTRTHAHTHTLTTEPPLPADRTAQFQPINKAISILLTQQNKNWGRTANCVHHPPTACITTSPQSLPFPATTLFDPFVTCQSEDWKGGWGWGGEEMARSARNPRREGIRGALPPVDSFSIQGGNKRLLPGFGAILRSGIVLLSPSPRTPFPCLIDGRRLLSFHVAHIES